MLCCDGFASKEEGSFDFVSFEVPFVSLGPSVPGDNSNSILCVSINDARADVCGKESMLSFRR